jgi:hypothetical protein
LNEAIEDETTIEEDKVEELLIGIKSQFHFDFLFIYLSFRFGANQ